MSKIVVDHNTLKRTLRRISYEIIEKTVNMDQVVLLGIQKKGARIAEILQEYIYQIEGIKVPQFPLVITPFRDDIKTEIPKTVNDENITLDLQGKIVILVDDVLYTGRTIRAAMDAVIELGRPEVIELAVLVDRGHRQLPIKANFVGKNIPTSKSEKIKVNITDLGENDNIMILK